MAITNIPKLNKIQTPTPEQMVKTLGVVGGVEYLSQIKASVKSIEKTLEARVQQGFSNTKENLKEAENQIFKNLGRKRRSDFGGIHKKASISEKVVPPKEMVSPKDVKQSERKKKEGRVISSIFKKMVSGVGNTIKNTFSFLKKGFKDFFEGLKKPVTKAFQAFLGPFNLILQPLNDLFGKGLGKLFGNIFGKIKNKWKEKGKKVKPNDTDIRQANPETYWLYKKLKGKEDPEGKGFGKILEGGFGKVASKLFPILAKALPIAALVGGVVWGVVDVFKALGKAEDWGVSKVSAGIAGFLAGSGEGGFKDAFKGMGKWALIGAGIGSIVPGIGTLAGGIVGAALGAIIGFIGGREVAQGLQNFGAGIKKIWTEGDIFDKIIGIPNFIFDSYLNLGAHLFATIPKMIASIFIKDKEKLDKIFNTSKDIFRIILEVINAPLVLLKNTFTSFLNIKDIFKDKDMAKDKKVKEILKQVLILPFQGLLKIPMIQKALETGTGKKVADFASSTFERAFAVGEDAFHYLKNSIKSIRAGELSVKDFVKDTVSNIFTFIKDGVNNFFKESPLGKWIKSHIINPVVNFFSSIGDFFGYIKSLGFSGFWDLIWGKIKIGEGYEEYVRDKEFLRYTDTEEYMEELQKTTQDIINQSLKSGVRLSQQDALSIAEDRLRKAHKVDDAIITPQGRIIEPHKDDTIIATKSPITHRKAGFEPTIKETQAVVNTSEIVENLKTLISVVKDKPFNNIFSTVNQSQINFAELRTT